MRAVEMTRGVLRTVLPAAGPSFQALFASERLMVNPPQLAPRRFRPHLITALAAEQSSASRPGGLSSGSARPETIWPVPTDGRSPSGPANVAGVEPESAGFWLFSDER
jgi:hypothetical protein